MRQYCRKTYIIPLKSQPSPCYYSKTASLKLSYIIKNIVTTLHSNDISLQCYSAEELFAIYHVDENDGFKMKRFESLSIALLDQIESNVCELEENNDVAEDGDDIEKMTNMTGEQRL